VVVAAAAVVVEEVEVGMKREPHLRAPPSQQFPPLLPVLSTKSEEQSEKTPTPKKGRDRTW